MVAFEHDHQPGVWISGGVCYNAGSADAFDGFAHHVPELGSA